ncbi:hypothetical protein RRG08_029659 [Elysia crispata]|uniref:Uncharacterized protein n=1 Tax=Elysia crispata TaxID=231223 RepID=A0AAE0XPD0_9GAST|nr:hypothetical protein RRG08_029659 [Elysia crispata]
MNVWYELALFETGFTAWPMNGDLSKTPGLSSWWICFGEDAITSVEKEVRNARFSHPCVVCVEREISRTWKELNLIGGDTKVSCNKERTDIYCVLTEATND